MRLAPVPWMQACAVTPFVSPLLLMNVFFLVDCSILVFELYSSRLIQHGPSSASLRAHRPCVRTVKACQSCAAPVELTWIQVVIFYNQPGQIEDWHLCTVPREREHLKRPLPSSAHSRIKPTQTWVVPGDIGADLLCACCPPQEHSVSFEKDALDAAARSSLATHPGHCSKGYAKEFRI